MKKILIIAAMAAAVLFTGCRKTSEFNKYLVEDYEYVKTLKPGVDVRLYEAQLTLSDSPAAVGKLAKPVSAKEVFQVDTLVVFIDRDYANGTFTVSETPGFWLEDVRFEPEPVADFTKALKALIKSDIKTPDSNIVVLRNPLGPKDFEYPFYIFGSQKSGFVAVDAGTLDVEVFE